MKHIVLISGLLLNILIADEISVSENFQDHYCKEIKHLSSSGTSNLKSDLIEPLKQQAKKLGANSLIKVKYSHNFLSGSNFKVEGIAAHCDLSRSPSFFIKSPSAQSSYVIDREKSDYTYFVGLDYGYSNFQFNITDSSNTSSNTMEPDVTAIKIGKYIENKRIIFQYAFYNTTSSEEINLMALSYDYIFSPKNTKARFFVGGTLSNVTFKVKNLVAKGYNKDEADISGLILSANAGVLVDLNLRSELEIGLKQSLFTNNQDSVSKDSTSTNIEIDSSYQLYLGYNFKF